MKQITVPGLTADGVGFKVNAPAADLFRFETPTKVWSSQGITEYGHAVALSGIGRSPLKLKADLWAPGFSLYVQNGLGLKLASLSSPYLSWADGSVGADVPTPRVRWLVVSFRDPQPPVLFAFMGKPEALKLTGKAGDWTLRTETPYTGWIRVVAPLGVDPRPTNTAKALGELSRRVAKGAERYIQPAPAFLGVTVADSPYAVTATWRFSKPGAVVPPALTLAALGGYTPKILSAVKKTEATTEYGPVTVCDEDKLVVRFPVRRLPTGRSLPLGVLPGEPLGTASSLDVPSICELALTNLTGSRDVLARTSAEEVQSEYLTDAEYVKEPYTGQQLPFAEDGRGGDLAAAHALLMQALYSTVSATSEPNSLLTSLTLRRDHVTWLFRADDPTVARRATALGSLAGAICPEPSRRLDAAQFEAGLAAERGLAVWKRRRGDIPSEPRLIEPLAALRLAFYGGEGSQGSADPFARSLLSEIRAYGEQGLVLERRKDGRLVLAWTAQDTRPVVVTLASAYPLGIQPLTSFERFSVADALGFTIIRCTAKDAGRCEAVVTVPSWASALPQVAAPHRYSESAR